MNKKRRKHSRPCQVFCAVVVVLLVFMGMGVSAGFRFYQKEACNVLPAEVKRSQSPVGELEVWEFRTEEKSLASGRAIHGPGQQDF